MCSNGRLAIETSLKDLMFSYNGEAGSNVKKPNHSEIKKIKILCLQISLILEVMILGAFFRVPYYRVKFAKDFCITRARFIIRQDPLIMRQF